MTRKIPSDFPNAKVAKQARLWLVWLVPAIALIVAGVLVAQQIAKRGPTITIQFKDGGGLQGNQTVLRYRGVQVGAVRSVRLAGDAQHIDVVARLDRSAASLARKGTIFWIVRPQVGAAGLSGLETIVSGVYIQAQPGPSNGPPLKKFIGAEEAPLIPENAAGVEYVLRTPSNATLNEGSPVYYRGMEVGSVNYLVLTSNSTSVDVHLLIKTNFAPLVRKDTVWWNAGGIKVNFHFFGIDVGAENFKSLIVGGIAFATPPEYGEIAPAGTVFTLHDKSDEKWLKWTPVIPLTNANPVAPSGSLPPIDLSRPTEK